jgi:nitrite reductase (NO-forming)
MSKLNNVLITPRLLAVLISTVFAGALLPPLAANAASDAAPVAAVTAQKASVKKFTLKTGMADGKMVFLDQQGKANPVLRAAVGDTVEIVLSSGEGAEHDLAVPDLNAASKKFNGGSGPITFSFKVTKAGKFAYICTIPGHRQMGMEGVLEVTGTAAASASAPSKAAAQAPVAPASFVPVALQSADPAAVSIVMNPAAVPPAVGKRAPQFIKHRIETVELAGKLDDGTTFTYWTFDRKVPGPMLRVRVGDTVEMTLANAANSKAVHSIDLHAVTGGLGGGADTQVAPGKEKTFTFKALNPGLYVYHCATPSVPHHIAAGMYGMILVEPEGGLPKVDREYYVMQGDIYTGKAIGAKGHQVFDGDKMAAELPEYYVFNGAVGALMKDNKLVAKVGETVRIYFGVGGPNKISSFHVIGEIFDKVYSEGSVSAVNRDVQTTLVAPGGATIVEFKVDYPGSYMLVDHALSRAGKGLVGILEVTGPEDASIYKVGKDVSKAM